MENHKEPGIAAAVQKQNRKDMLEDIAKLTPPLNLLDHVPHDADRLRTVAEFKRMCLPAWRSRPSIMPIRLPSQDIVRPLRKRLPRRI